jgi:nicotinic acid mononucleotide adenylyltransferase
MLAALHAWKDIELLLNIANPLIGGRFENFKKGSIKLHGDIIKIIEKGICKIPMMDISSTMVRERIKNKKYCPVCGGSKVVDVEMSYAFKLLMDELKCMLIYPKMVAKEE